MDLKELVKEVEKRQQPKESETPKFQGKGTRARLNTAAEKHLFNSKYSK